MAGAFAVWEKIRSTKGIDWDADEEEYEDADGNVMMKKTFKDLKRQGLA